VDLEFICVRAFCRCWVWVAASWTRESRCRSRDRTAHTVSGGRNEARRSPTAWRYWSHWQSWTSVFRGDILHMAGRSQADRNAAGLQDLVQGDPVHAGGLPWPRW